MPKSELIEEIKRLKDENNELTKKMLKSQKMALLGTFSAGIFHELINPLHGIVGAHAVIARELKFLEKTESVEKMLRCARAIESSTELADKILANLRNYSSNSIEGMFEDLRAADVIDTVVTLVKDRAADRRIGIQVDIKNDFKIHANRAGIYQLIMNLVSNAVDASSAKMDVFIRAFSDEKNWTLEIEDQGIGIAEENLPKLMEAFFTTKTDGHGTGLGLFIVQKELERHHGKLEIKSKINKGTKFSILFPLGITEPRR